MASRLKTPDSLPGGVWQDLLHHAYSLVDEIATHGIQNPFWTFGGGTVLMLRYRHPMSKDIDIFVPDPQYLGFVSPRLSDAAEAVSDKYVEGPGFVKLLRPEGDIDFVASPNLTSDPFEEWEQLTHPFKTVNEQLPQLLNINLNLSTTGEFITKEASHPQIDRMVQLVEEESPVGPCRVQAGHEG